jgi:cell shape-determining protein MreC
MKNTIVAIASCLVLTSAFSQDMTQCRAIDFSELSTFNKNELAEKYCQNIKIIEFGHKQQERIQQYQSERLDFALKMAQIGSFRDSEKTRNEANDKNADIINISQNIQNCQAENKRITRPLSSKNTKIDGCEPTPSFSLIKEEPTVTLSPLENEYCSVKSNIAKLLDEGKSFSKESQKIEQIKVKLKNAKIQPPAKCL